MVTPSGIYRYDYDANSNINSITAPDNGVITIAYDGSLPTAQTWTGEVNGKVSYSYNNHLLASQQCINDSHCIDYSYDGDGLLVSAGDLTITRNVQKGGVIDSKDLANLNQGLLYNSFGELVSDITQFNDTELYNATYTRDKLGRITTRSQVLPSGTELQSYHYNDAGRLATVTEGSKTTTYGYDDNGNRLSKQINDGATTITETGTYDEQDRLLTYDGCTFEYSDNGELAKRICGTEVTAYDYDVLGNLRSVTLPDATNIDYVIDGQNRRVGKKVNGTLQQGFLYGDQLNPVAELDQNNNIVSQFIYGTKVNVPDYMIKGGITYQIITDQLGSPRLIVNSETGAVAQKIDYDEFGQIINDTNPGFQPFGFAGGLYDQHSKLTRFGARDYDAQVGRWTSKDPIRFAGGDSNIYGYVFNDPVNFIDPNGKFLFNVHFAMSYVAAVKAGYGAIDAIKIASYVVWADVGTQGVADSYRHAMTEKGGNKSDAKKLTDMFIQKQLSMGEFANLGNALHAAQDFYAWGHGFQEYDGTVDISHIWNDTFPNTRDFNIAYEKTLEILLKYKKGCY